ncbi:MAG: energy transducer TonB [Solirubrobacterales bacterium]|jgi:TonB family protein
MFSFAHMSFLVQAGALAVLAVAFLAFLGIVALRFMRRGAARFWAAPGAVALVLLPAVLAAGVTVVAFRETLRGIALVGSGGLAALAAGSAEALIPLLVGLATVAALAFVGLLLTSMGSSRVTQGGSGGGLALPAATLVALSLGASLIVLTVQMVAAVNAPRDPALPGAGQRDVQVLLLGLNVSLVGSPVLAMLLFVLALVTALRAPRSAASLGVKLSALAAFSLCGLLALAGVWAVYGEMQSYLTTARTGSPVGVAVAEPPTPPPAPGRTGQSSPDAGRGENVEGGDRRSDAVRVGGQIKAPKRLKHVAPGYPEIARQARVQGVVILECTIDPEGKVTRVTVLRGIPLLDQAAVDAVKQWVYAPTLLNGLPVPLIMTVTVNFRLAPG